MRETPITLTPAQRWQFAAVLGTLEHILEEQDFSGPTEGAIAGLEGLLRHACPHNPKTHTLHDIRHGWKETDHADAERR